MTANESNSRQHLAGVVGERPDRAECIARALHGAFCRGASRHELLALAARKIFASAPSADGVYAYAVEGEALHLAAVEGTTVDHDCIPIAAHAGNPRLLQERLADMISHDWGWDRAILSLIRRHDLVLGSIMVRTSSTPAQVGADVQRVADALAALL